MDCFKLISAVKKKQVLWDTTMRMSDRKAIFTSDWMEVASEMNMDVESTRKRWKSLRDHYRSEIRRMQQKQISTSTWKFFQVMEFLRPIFDPDKLVSFDPEKPEIGFEVTISHESDGNKTFIDLDDEPITLDNDDSFGFDVIDEDIFNQTTNSTSRISPPPAKKSRNAESSDGAIQNTSSNNNEKQIKEPAPNLPTQKDNAKVDSDYNFLVSMLPHMKSLSDMGNLKFRMEVSKVLIDLKESEMRTKPDQQPHEMRSKTDHQPHEMRSKTGHQPHEMRSKPDQQSYENPTMKTVHTQHIDGHEFKTNDSKYNMNGYLASDFLEFELKIENEPITN